MPNNNKVTVMRKTPDYARLTTAFFNAVSQGRHTYSHIYFFIIYEQL